MAKTAYIGGRTEQWRKDFLDGLKRDLDRSEIWILESFIDIIKDDKSVITYLRNKKKRETT